MPPASPAQGLSPGQHRTIRVHLALIPAYVWLFYVWPVFFAQLPVRPTADQPHLVRDFFHFYVVGTITREHDAHALYDIDAMAAVAERVLPGVPKNIVPPVYGPQVGLLFAPFSELDYLSALYVWLALTLVGTGVCVYLVWQSSDVRRFPWPVAVFALGMPGLHFALSFGQTSVLGLACFTALWLALRRGHHVAAGVAVGALAYKPQLGLVVACVFILRREWRVVGGAVLAIAAQCLAAWAYWGTSIFEAYARAIPRYLSLFGAMEPDAQLAYSMRAVLLGLHLEPRWAVAASVSLSVVVIGFAVAAWRHEVPIDVRYVGLVFATLLIDPHLYGYDLLLAAPALLLAGDRAWRRRDQIGVVCVTALYSAPILTMLLPGPSVLTTLALVAVTGWTIGRSLRETPIEASDKSASH